MSLGFVDDVNSPSKKRQFFKVDEVRAVRNGVKRLCIVNKSKVFGAYPLKREKREFGFKQGGSISSVIVFHVHEIAKIFELNDVARFYSFPRSFHGANGGDIERGENLE